MTRFVRALTFFVVLLLITGLATYARFFHHENPESTVVISSITPEITALLSPSATAIPTSATKLLPQSVLLPVSFIPQAPLKVWDALHEDACEEASLLTVFHFLRHYKAATPLDNDNSLSKMVAWEEAQQYGPSISLSDLNVVAAKYLQLTSGKVFSDITQKQIQTALANGNPVILGMAGKLLKNPHFKNGGPNYHMLVVIGYDETGFITNDPGTQFGEHYHYLYQTFFQAIHNWNATDITLGGKDMLIFENISG